MAIVVNQKDEVFCKKEGFIWCKSCSVQARVQFKGANRVKLGTVKSYNIERAGSKKRKYAQEGAASEEDEVASDQDDDTSEQDDDTSEQDVDALVDASKQDDNVSEQENDAPPQLEVSERVIRAQKFTSALTTRVVDQQLHPIAHSAVTKKAADDMGGTVEQSGKDETVAEYSNFGLRVGQRVGQESREDMQQSAVLLRKLLEAYDKTPVAEREGKFCKVGKKTHKNRLTAPDVAEMTQLNEYHVRIAFGVLRAQDTWPKVWANAWPQIKWTSEFKGMLLNSKSFQCLTEEMIQRVYDTWVNEWNIAMREQ